MYVIKAHDTDGGPLFWTRTRTWTRYRSSAKVMTFATREEAERVSESVGRDECVLALPVRA